MTQSSEDVTDVAPERLDALEALVHDAESGRLEPTEIRLVEVVHEWIMALDKDGWTNLDLAGAFFLIAVRLILLKVRLLLPSPPIEEEPSVLPDMEEMRLVYGMGEQLGALEEWERGFELCGIAADLSSAEMKWKDVELLPSLLVAAGSLFLRAEMQQPHVLTGEAISPEEAIERVVGFLSRKKLVVEDLLGQATSLLEMLSYFLAVLELIRRGSCTLRERRGSIWVRLITPQTSQERGNARG